MVRIINLLNQKNHLLENFYSINETELVNFNVGNFDNLDHFYQSREKIIEMIRYLDSQIDSIQRDILTPNDNEKSELRQALAIKDEYVNRILAQDLEVLACIENAKSGIIKELQEIRKVKKAVGSYKSRSTYTSYKEEA